MTKKSLSYTAPQTGGYESPSLEVISFSSEIGFASSGIEDLWGDGLIPDNGWNDNGGY